MNANFPPVDSDLLLIYETDPATAAVLREVADRLGCDRVEIDGMAALEALLQMRRPTLAVLTIDGPEADGLQILQTLAQHGARPATILVGNQSERVLAGVQRIAVSRGFAVIGARRRGLAQPDIEHLFLKHVIAPLPITADELERALAEQELLLLYQPKVSLADGGMPIIGVEALVRWRHPRRGLLLPRHFLAAVEQHGMLVHLTDVVITEAIRQAGVWNSRGIHMQMSINLSPRLVKDRAFPDRLSALLREQDLSPSQVMLDVTETAGAQDRELIQDVFARLRLMGIGLALDNFGTGLSSLSELYRTPFSEIKIDRKLLEDASCDHDAELIVRALVNLAHQLGIVVCAEGVETAQALEFIRSAGFDSAQGRLFSEPVAPGGIEHMLETLARAQPAGTGAWRALRSPASRARRDLSGGDLLAAVAGAS